MPETGIPAAYIVIAMCAAFFLIGAAPFSLIVAKLAGAGDIRSQGSGNPGATNVARVAGKKAGAVALALDVLKAFLPVFFVTHMIDGGNRGEAAYITAGAVLGFCTVLGHVYSPFLRFKGGKGVATYLGMLAGLYWLLGVIFMALWLAGYALRKISAQGAAAALCGSAFASFALLPLPAALFCVIAALLSLWRHRKNFKRMRDGEEFSFKDAER